MKHAQNIAFFTSFWLQIGHDLLVLRAEPSLSLSASSVLSRCPFVLSPCLVHLDYPQDGVCGRPRVGAPQLGLADPWGAFPAYVSCGFDLASLRSPATVLPADPDLANDCDNLQHHQENMLHHSL